MSRNLLQSVQDVAGEVGISSPSSVTGSADTSIVQLLALYNRLGNDLIQDYEWRQATFIKVFPTVDPVTLTGTTAVDSAVITGISSTASLSAGMQVAGTGISTNALILTVDSATQVTMDMVCTAAGSVSLSFYTQDFALPTGFDRMVPQTNWNRSQHWANVGGKSAQEWQWLNGGAIATAPRYRYRIVGTKLRIFPAPTDVFNFAYEYVTQYWVIPAAGTAPTKARTTADTDLCIFPDSMVAWGLKFYWERANKLEFATSEAVFMDLLSKAKSGDDDNPTLSLSGDKAGFLIGQESIQEGNWSL